MWEKVICRKFSPFGYKAYCSDEVALVSRGILGMEHYHRLHICSCDTHSKQCNKLVRTGLRPQHQSQLALVEEIELLKINLN